jgi:LysR family nitrogen assimilation transcriptional regulator
MELKQLRYFAAIAEAGSVSAAAARIGIAQPSLSQHVANLEDQLGVQLFVRSARGVTLTEQGELLLSRARDIIASVERTVEEVRFSGAEPRGPVTFGLPSSVSMVMSVPLAETVRIGFPKVQLRVVEAMSGFIQEWLEEQSIDLAILYDVSAVRHMQLRPLLTETLDFFSAPDAWPFETPPGTPLRLADVARQDLVLPSRTHGLRVMIDRYARTSGLHLEAVVEMDSLAQIKTLVGRGSACTILAPAAAQDAVDRGELATAPIVDPVMRRPAYLVRNPLRPVTRASAEVEQEAVRVVADLVTRRIWRGELTAQP